MARKISRRSFLTSGAALAAASVLAGCEQTRRWVTLEPYVRPPEEQLDGVPTWYASTCRQCPAGCGIIVRVINGRAVKVEGNPEHPLNRGKLCAQGQALPQVLYNPDRLLTPMQTARRGSRDFPPVPRNDAIGLLAGKIKDAGSGVAVLVSPTISGHLYDLFSRLTKAIGAPVPLVFDLRTALNGHPGLSATANQVFGRPGLPAYNVGGADVILSFGADFLGTWVSPVRYGVEYGRFRSQGKGLRGYLVQFEPNMSITGAKADRWVGIRPGYEGQVAQAIARIIADQKLGPADRAARVAGLAGSVDVNAVAQANDVSVETLTSLARVFAEAAHPLAIPGNSLAGPDAVAAVQALNLIDNASGVILSSDPPVPDVLRPLVSTYDGVQRLIDQMRSGAVKVLLVYGTNPAYELPDKVGFLDALDKVGFVASFSNFMDEMAANAHLALPERAALESWGYTVVSPDFGIPTITSQQPVVPALNGVQSTGDVLIQAARNVPAVAGSFPWQDEVAFLQEIVGKLPPGAAGGSGAEVLWPRFLQHGGWWPTQAPAPAAALGGSLPAISAGQVQEQGDRAQYPYYLQPFMGPLTMTGALANVPWIQGSSDPMTSIAWQTWAAVHPDTARRLGVEKGDVVRVTTPNGEIEAVVYVYPPIRRDTVAIPLGQGHTILGRYAEGQGANVMRLLGAEAGPGGNAPAWTGQRCQVNKTGKKVNVATLEWTPGVEQGFANKGFPGE